MRTVSAITARFGLALVLVDEVQAREEARDDGDQQDDDDDFHGDRVYSAMRTGRRTLALRAGASCPRSPRWRCSRSRSRSARWQVKRAEEKQARQALLEARDARARRCTLSGAAARPPRRSLYRRVRAEGRLARRGPGLHRQPPARGPRGLPRGDAARSSRAAPPRCS